MYPAAYSNDSIISVASTTGSDGLSGFSNYGLTTVDLGAPGSRIYSTTPNNNYGNKSGTSMACPNVAGAVALLRSYVPFYTQQEVKQRILDSADPISALDGKCVTGGRLNVHQMLQISQDKFLVYADSTVDDASGNGDGFINPGEEIDLTVICRNVGTDAVSAVSATVTTTDSNVTVLDGDIVSVMRPAVACRHQQMSRSSTVAAGESTTFVIEFTPSVLGESSATVNIQSDDPDHPTYDFAVKANVLETLPPVGGGGGGDDDDGCSLGGRPAVQSAAAAAGFAGREYRSNYQKQDVH